ncbi:helix-turn-helix domain-containing protein [bacterium]|nr:helix-turn-helix domain-containing protein [bacterium]MBU1025254.1 helix-turn-helix domain-containing protein [bacterium]
MSDKVEKKKTGKARETMPSGLPRKNAKRLSDWQKYVRKETQRIQRDGEFGKPKEVTKPPLPKGPTSRASEKIVSSKTALQKKQKEVLTNDLKEIDVDNEFDSNLDILLSESTVELDETLQTFVDPESLIKPAAHALPKKIADKTKKPNAFQKDGRTKQETLELFGEKLEKARRRRTSPRKTREHLIENLLDPVISLDEAALILNVCKTTVRRYTNAEKIECLRTPGNQRRFRLSRVLEFLEEKEGRKASRMPDDLRD